jgi:2,3-bisphosphoglycerate-dependent phosphoglycerate mutase
MSRPSTLVLIRHGESARNEAKKGATYFADEYARAKIKGIPDHKIELTKRGVDQARQTGRAVFNAHKFDYAYHSGYLRTEQTLDAMLEALTDHDRARVKVRPNLFIRERDPGHAYDMTTEEAERHFPYLHEYWQTYGGFFAVPPGGESLAHVCERVHTFLDTLFRDRAGQNVLVVTHGGTLRCFRYLLERWSYDQATKWPPGQSPQNCGVTVYTYDQLLQRLVLRDYNRVLWE